jgi:restriction system protein
LASPIRCPFCRNDVPIGRVTCPYCLQRLPQYLRAQAAAAREAERQQKAAEKARLAAQRAAAHTEVEAAIAEVDRMNKHLDAVVESLMRLLAHTLSVDDFLEFETLKDSSDVPEFDPGPLGVPIPAPTYEEPALELPRSPSSFGKLFGGKKRFEEELAVATRAHEGAVADAKAKHATALEEHASQEQERETKLAKARQEHDEAAEQLRRGVAAQHQRIDEFRDAFAAGDASAVCSYFDLVLQRSAYPEGFPKKTRLAFVPDSKQLVIEYDLPTFEVVPSVGAYKYVKAKKEISQTPRPITQRKQIYSSVVAQTVIRTLHEVFEADRGEIIETVVLNAHVDAIDKGTGQPIRPCLVTLRTTRDTFKGIDLRQVEPVACLRVLNASLSKSPAELAPVRPVLDFNMVDPRFIDSPDVISELDERPNLMELSPTEFEGLVTNLFEKMGLEMRQTRPSRDGGVDCVAYDPRPIFGGKVVIQAKRYKNTVGVAAVRDLFGTVHNEGASKGILVATSGYGSASFEFAAGKPLELLDGANLLYLLANHAGIEAKIVPPDDWVDPVADM